MLFAAPARCGEAPGLKAFVERALQHDLSYQSAVASSTLGDAQWRATLASFVPRVLPYYNFNQDQTGVSSRNYGLGIAWDTGYGAALGANYSRSNVDTSGGLQPASTTDRSVQVTVPLGASFGRLPSKITIEASRAALNASQRSLKEARQFSILSIVEIYYSYLQARKSLQVAEESVERARKNGEISLMKFKLGEISHIDLDRAQQLLQQAQFTTAMARNELARVRFLIQNGYGVSDIEEFTFSIPPVERFALAWSPPEAIAMALAVNPGLTNAREQLDIAQLRLKLARRQLLPSIDATYRVGSRSGGFSADSALPSNSYHQFSLTSNLSLDYTNRRLSLLGAEVSMKTQGLSLRQLEQNLRSQLESQLESFSRKQDLIDFARRSLETARNQTELANLRYERGIGTAFDVVDSQAQLQSTELQVLSSEIDLILSYYQILFQLQLLDLDRLIE